VDGNDVVQVIVPEGSWTSLEPQATTAPAITLPYPIGSGDNRYERRRGEHARIAAMWRDRGELANMCWSSRGAPPGTYVARLQRGRIALEVAS
jgi:hypothetical protein